MHEIPRIGEARDHQDHNDRQMIGNEIMAMLGEGGEPWRVPDDMEVRTNAWGIPEFYGRYQS